MRYAQLEDLVLLSTVNRDFRDAYHFLGFEHIYPSLVMRPLEEILYAYITYHKYLPKQGTDQWLKLRITTVGGSELATVLGENKYQKLKDFVGGKLGIEKYKFSGNTATRWGKMFEPIFRTYVETLFSNNIHETGSIPGYRNDGVVIQSYSPDGIGICDTSVIKKYIDISGQQYLGEAPSQDSKFNNIMVRNKQIITLFEFKCPLRMTLNGKVPDNYISQPLAGLCTIPITKMALFMQGVYRRCTTEDFILNSKYDPIFHDSYGPQPTYPMPITMGFVGFYKRDETFRGRRITAQQRDSPALEVITTKFITETQKPHSRYYNLKAGMTTVVLCAKLLSTIVTDTVSGWEAFLSLCPEDKREKISASKVMQQAFNQTYPEIYNLDTLCVGDDLSQTAKGDFETFMDDVIDHNAAQLYYPDGMYHSQPEMDDIFDGPPANYIDPSRCPQRWLYYNLRDFETYCRTNNYKPIGYMPWKLFEYTCIPVYKDDKYIIRNLPKIEYAHSLINKIRTTTERANFEEELEKAFGGTVVGKKVNSKPVITASTSQSYSDMDDFFANI